MWEAVRRCRSVGGLKESSWTILQQIGGLPLFTLVWFSSETSRISSLPLSLVLVIAAHSFSILPIPSSSPRFILPLTLLYLHVCLCFSLITSPVPAVSFFPGLEEIIPWITPFRTVLGTLDPGMCCKAMGACQRLCWPLRASYLLSFVSVRRCALPVGKCWPVIIYLSQIVYEG